jgi:ABC-type polysaccharide transport system permease subunit
MSIKCCFNKKKWVRSSVPHPISLSLKTLQGILDVIKDMDIDVFNLAVRMLACDEVTVLREPKTHFMDLKFSVSYYTLYWNNIIYMQAHKYLLLDNDNI